MWAPEALVQQKQIYRRWNQQTCSHSGEQALFYPWSPLLWDTWSSRARIDSMHFSNLNGSSWKNPRLQMRSVRWSVDAEVLLPGWGHKGPQWVGFSHMSSSFLYIKVGMRLISKPWFTWHHIQILLKVRLKQSIWNIVYYSILIIKWSSSNCDHLSVKRDVQQQKHN